MTTMHSGKQNEAIHLSPYYCYSVTPLPFTSFQAEEQGKGLNIMIAYSFKALTRA